MMADLFGDNDVDIDIHDSDSNDFVSNVRNESNVSPQVSEFLSIPNSQGKITASMVNDNLNTHTLNIMEYLTKQEERRREEREARMKRESEEREARMKRESEEKQRQREKSEERQRERVLEEKRRQKEQQTIWADISKTIVRDREHSDNALEQIKQTMIQNFEKLFSDNSSVKEGLVQVEGRQVELTKRVEALEDNHQRVSNTLRDVNTRISRHDVSLSKCSKDIYDLKEEFSRLNVRPNKERRFSGQRSDHTLSDNDTVDFERRHTHLMSGGRANHDRSQTPNSNPFMNKREDNESPSKFLKAPVDYWQPRVNVFPEPMRNRPNEPVTRNPPVNFPPFSGDVDLEIYRRQCQALATCHNWSERDVASQVIANLRGDARELISLLPQGHELDLDAIWDILASRFSKVISCDTAKHQLLHYVQKKGQTFLNLSLELEKLVAKAYPTADNQTREQLAVDHFVKAINNSSLRYELRMRGVVTLADARRQAEIIATVLNAERYQRPIQIHRVEVLSSSDSDSEEVQRKTKKKKKKGNDSKNVNSKSKSSNGNQKPSNSNEYKKDFCNQAPSQNSDKSFVNQNVPPVFNKVSPCTDNVNVRPADSQDKIVNTADAQKNRDDTGYQNQRGGGNYGYNPNYRHNFRGRGNGKRSWWQRNMWNYDQQNGQVEQVGHPKQPRAQE
jgi:hypothetical protein